MKTSSKLHIQMVHCFSISVIAIMVLMRWTKVVRRHISVKNKNIYIKKEQTNKKNSILLKVSTIWREKICKHFFKNNFLANEFCTSLTNKIPKKSFTELLEQKFALFHLLYADCQFLHNRKDTFEKTLRFILSNVFSST